MLYQTLYFINLWFIVPVLRDESTSLKSYPYSVTFYILLYEIFDKSTCQFKMAALGCLLGSVAILFLIYSSNVAGESKTGGDNNGENQIYINDYVIATLMEL